MPYGVRFLSALKVVENNDISFSIGCLGGPEQGPLTPKAIQFVQRLLPDLHQYIATSIYDKVLTRLWSD